eukprot:TRINITY_DN7586_c2_g3_i1.p1 TRINITY_DN7586_c2_g3~~TRINITY_DN7586_c2_g3_i1.p1  ORF type:complete len:1128 (+),score=171.38 TRINITY_DN7586_c2_g3_i1:112-3495(+)
MSSHDEEDDFEEEETTLRGIPLCVLVGVVIIFMALSLTGVWLIGKYVSEYGVGVLQEELLDQIVNSTLRQVNNKLSEPFANLDRLDSLLFSEPNFETIKTINLSDPSVYSSALPWHLRELCDQRMTSSLAGFYLGSSEKYFAGALCDRPNHLLSYVDNFNLNRTYFESPYRNFSEIIYLPNSSRTFDATSRSWYKGAQLAGPGGLTYTEMYNCFTSEVDCISGTKGIFGPDGEMVVAVEFDYEIRGLTAILDSAEVNSDSGGIFIMTPEKVISRSSHNHDIMDQITNRLMLHSDFSRNLSVQFSIDGKSYYVDVFSVQPFHNGQPIGITSGDTLYPMDWHLVIFLPKSYFFGKIDSWNRISLSIFISVVAFATLVMSLSVVFGLVLPVRRLIGAMDEVTCCNFESEKIAQIEEPQRGITVQEVHKLNTRFTTMVKFLMELQPYNFPAVAAQDLQGSGNVINPLVNATTINDVSATITMRDRGYGTTATSQQFDSVGHSVSIRKGVLRSFGYLFRKDFATIMSIQIDLSSTTEVELSNFAQKTVATTLEKVVGFGGVVISIMANTLTASWAALLPHTHHQEAAVHCSLAILSSMSSKKLDNLVSCVIASSQVFVGNLGSETQRAPVVYGESMLLCSKLLSLCSALDICILATEKVITPQIAASYSRPVEVVAIPEINNNTDFIVYEITDTEKVLALVKSKYNTAFNRLRGMRLEEARDSFLHYFSLGKGVDKQSMRLFKITLYLMNRAAQGDVWNSYYQEYPSWKGEAEFFGDWEMSSRMRSHLSDLQRRNNGGPEDNIPYPPTSGLTSAVMSLPVQPPSLRTIPKGDSSRAPFIFIDTNKHKYQRSAFSLGQGAFGEVWLSMGFDGTLVALKGIELHNYDVSDKRMADSIEDMMSRSTDLDHASLQILSEVELLSRLRHDNIVSYVTSGLSDGHLFIVMEYVSGGNLAKILRYFRTRNTGLPMSSVKRYISDVLAGLQYLHSLDVIHCDIKPENILLSSSGVCKLADFGAATLLGSFDRNRRTHPLGTVLYMSPEACNHAPCKASDIWSVGVTMCQIVTGELPWRKLSQADLSDKKFYSLMILEQNYPVPDIPNSAATDVITSCLNRDPKARPTAPQLIRDPLFASV